MAMTTAEEANAAFADDILDLTDQFIHLKEDYDDMGIELASLRTFKKSTELYIEELHTKIHDLETRMHERDAEIELLQSDLYRARESGIEIQISTTKKLETRHQRDISRISDAMHSSLQKQIRGG